MFKIINGKLHHYGHDGSLLAIVEEAHWSDYAAQVPEAADFLPQPEPEQPPQPEPVDPPPAEPSPLIFLQEPANGQETPPAP